MKGHGSKDTWLVFDVIDRGEPATGHNERGDLVKGTGSENVPHSHVLNGSKQCRTAFKMTREKDIVAIQI